MKPNRYLKPVIIFLVALILLLLGISALRRSQPEPTLKLPPKPPTTTLNQIKYSGDPLVLPPTLKTYTTQTISVDALAQNLVSALNLSLKPDFNSLWVSPDDTVDLTIDTNLAYLQLNKKISISPPDQPIDPNLAIKAAKQYLTDLGLTTQTDLISFTPAFYTDDFEPKPVDQSVADLVKIDLRPKIDDYPIITGQNTTTDAFIFIDKAYNWRKIIVSQSLTTLESRQETTLNINQAIENIKQNNYFLVDQFNQKSASIKSSDLQNVSLTNVDLEYRLSPQNQTLTPYYHFYGTGLDQPTNTVSVIELITSAIK